LLFLLKKRSTPVSKGIRGEGGKLLKKSMNTNEMLYWWQVPTRVIMENVTKNVDDDDDESAKPRHKSDLYILENSLSIT
jgi:hypothetical protein